MKNTMVLPGILFLLLALSLPAQSTQVVPASLATKDGNSSGAYPFGYTTCLTQQIVRGSAFCQASALLTGIALRRDGKSTGNMLARVVPNFTVKVGHTTVGPSTMSNTFAANRTGTLTTVFSGNYNLPANPPANPGSFNIKWTWTKPFLFLIPKGNLLIELTAPGTVGKSSYFVDHEKITLGSGGKVSSYGSPGTFAGKDPYRVDVPGSGAGVAPGGAFALEVKGLLKQYANLAIFGRSRTASGPLSLPFALGPLGAPGNFLFTEVFLTAPITLAAQGSTYEGTASLPIPDDAIYTGLTLYGQVVFLDGASNPLGLVASQGLSMTTGAPLPPFRLLGNYQATSTTGSLHSSGFVLQLRGIFN